ncbi:GntR family transcriptional regulator [Microvirga sp. W0021]|uniref:GntR family transcriptional regulator n=1 Tax=Hohaiivirga grylli TaxID=3133970 RepID=A0ABV0BI04_9HYPH
MPERYTSISLRNNLRSHGVTENLTSVETEIHDRIWNAILDRKLRPGAKLHEDMVGNAFGVSRTIVRKVFLIMEQEGVIALPLNRGAFVASPAPDEIKPLLETIRLVMPYLITWLCNNLDDSMRERLESHFNITEEHDLSQEVRILRRLAHEHYVLIADLYGNPILSSLIEKVIVRTSMAMTLYQDTVTGWRPADSNKQINEAILEGDAEKAISIMMNHLALIEATMQYNSPETTFDISSILSADDEEIYPRARKSTKGRPRKVPAEANGVSH